MHISTRIWRIERIAYFKDFDLVWFLLNYQTVIFWDSKHCYRFFVNMTIAVVMPHRGYDSVSIINQ